MTWCLSNQPPRVLREQVERDRFDAVVLGLAHTPFRIPLAQAAEKEWSS
jgi:hypothetical protein